MDVPRRRLQFHLSSAIVVMLGVGFFGWLNSTTFMHTEIKLQWYEHVWHEMAPGEFGTYNPGDDVKLARPLEITVFVYTKGWPLSHSLNKVSEIPSHPPTIEFYQAPSFQLMPHILLIDISIALICVAALGAGSEYLIRRRTLTPIIETLHVRARNFFDWAMNVFHADFHRD